MKKIFIFAFLLLTTLVLVSCGEKGGKVQGIDEEKKTILVGNTATTSGQYATVGTPFNDAIKAVFEKVNKAGGINGYTIEFKHYDDAGPGGNGVALTERLIEEDKVFALVGHFGTWTVAPTVEKIIETGIPMVHAATGVNDLYFENDPGNPVMAIQPIYKTDGRVMVARAVASTIYGTAKTALPSGSKVGVLYSNDDAGKSIKDGVEQQFKALSEAETPLNFDVQYLEVSEGTYATQVNKIANVDVIILAMNQTPFGASLSALHNAKNKAPIFTSYVNADTTHIKEAEDQVGDIYVNGWYSGSAEDQKEYEATLNASSLSAELKAERANNTHAKSGYIAAMSFVEGLKRVGTEKLTWESYIQAMEKGVLSLPLAGSVDFRNGNRIGTDTMSVSKYDRETNKLVVVDSLKSIGEILGEKDKGRGELAQGVNLATKTITVGNTAATSGGFATVGVPFNAALKAAFEQYNKDETKLWDIDFKHYDDGFSASTGVTLTERLVEEDKVFALVGHFGTPTVGATIGYIQDQKIPMVYAATGINALYFEATPGNSVMAVQPIYKTDGRLMAARLLNEKIFGANKDQVLEKGAKVAVVYTNADDGKGIREGVLQELNAAGGATVKEIVLDPDAAQNAVNQIDADTQAVIIASNQGGFKAMTSALYSGVKKFPVFTSYVNADATAVDDKITDYGFDIYTNAWVDIVSEKGQKDLVGYMAAINAATFLSEEQKTAYLGNSFAIAGYIAAKVFLEGIDRVGEKTMSWENYIDGMESKAISIPMGGSVNFSNGRRWGIDSMALLKYNAGTKLFEQVRPIQTIDEIKAK